MKQNDWKFRAEFKQLWSLLNTTMMRTGFLGAN